jgi:8-oxo-dGTP pyrophosphatase MutT (NUDIX family)
MINTIELWEDFWGLDAKKKMLNKKQFTEAKENYESLKNKIGVELSLEFYIKNIKPDYNYPEWGFPKGRKQRGENDLDCAKREFFEETGYVQQDIKILNNVKPIVENMIGTNGVSYRFIYYLAEDISLNVPIISDKNNNEIGDIGFFTYDETLQLFREYHIEKRNITKNIFLFYLDNLIKKDKNNNFSEEIKNEENWLVENDEF